MRLVSYDIASALSRYHFVEEHDSSSCGGSNTLRAPPSQKIGGAQPPLAPPIPAPLVLHTYIRPIKCFEIYACRASSNIFVRLDICYKLYFVKKVKKMGKGHVHDLTLALLFYSSGTGNMRCCIELGGGRSCRSIRSLAFPVFVEFYLGSVVATGNYGACSEHA